MVEPQFQAIAMLGTLAVQTSFAMLSRLSVETCFAVKACLAMGNAGFSRGIRWHCGCQRESDHGQHGE
jgi:hypothetical protein